MSKEGEIQLPLNNNQSTSMRKKKKNKGGRIPKNPITPVGWIRKKKIELIERTNPKFRDLSEDWKK